MLQVQAPLQNLRMHPRHQDLWPDLQICNHVECCHPQWHWQLQFSTEVEGKLNTVVRESLAFLNWSPKKMQINVQALLPSLPPNSDWQSLAGSVYCTTGYP